jgi:hypothetical protein
MLVVVLGLEGACHLDKYFIALASDLCSAVHPPTLLGDNPLHHKLALARARAICEC